jgi:hypothetical protein
MSHTDKAAAFKNFQPRPVANNDALKARIDEATSVINSFENTATGTAVLFSGMTVERAREIGVH